MRKRKKKKEEEKKREYHNYETTITWIKKIGILNDLGQCSPKKEGHSEKSTETFLTLSILRNIIKSHQDDI